MKQSPPVEQKSPHTPYYRRPNEQVGVSLYRDHLNRQKRSKIAVIATDLKAKIEQDTKYVAPKSEQLLTEKLEKDIDILLKRWLSEKITHLTRNTVCDLLTNFGVF